ncbi:MAG: AAA family ATPase, partial [Sphingobacteriaceae bacterium]
MLSKLIIQNFAIIDQLEITFHEDLSIITGETGAGKSIILGALGLLLGNRADAKSLKHSDQK